MSRVRFVSFALLAFPLALHAQQAMHTADPVAQSFQSAHTQYAAWLVAAFDAIPQPKYGYKPTPAQLTVGYIAQHVEASNYYLCSRFADMPHAPSAADAAPDSVKARWPKDTLVARVRASFEFCNSALAAVRDAGLGDPVPLGEGQRIARSQLLVAYVTDLADHWAQIAGYMRLNGMIPPSAMPRPRS